MNFRPRFDVDQLSLASGHFHWSNNQVDEITVITQTHTNDEKSFIFSSLTTQLDMARSDPACSEVLRIA